MPKSGSAPFDVRQVLRRIQPQARREEVRTFMEVSETVWNHWSAGNHRPIGEQLIRLAYLSEEIGILTDPFGKNIAPIANRAGRAVALRAIPIEDVVTTVLNNGQKSTSCRSAVLKILTNARSINKERSARLEKLLLEREEQIKDATRLFRAHVLRMHAGSSTDVSRTEIAEPIDQKIPPADVPSVPRSLELRFQALLIALDLRDLLPKLELVNSDDFPREQRDRIRELCGSEILRLANEVYRLTSETARTQLGRKPIAPPSVATPTDKEKS